MKKTRLENNAKLTETENVKRERRTMCVCVCVSTVVYVFDASVYTTARSFRRTFLYFAFSLEKSSR